VNKDDMNDDAEFDAFLKGEGDLARRMRGVAQPEPGAALDAAILASARAAIAQEVRPRAANDSGTAPAPRRATAMGWRWRVPAGIAATVLVGVFAQQSFESGGELNTSTAQVSAEMPGVAAPEQRVMADAPAPAAPQVEVAPAPAAPAVVVAPAPKVAPRVRAESVLPAPAPAPAPAFAPAPAPPLSYSGAPVAAPPFEPAPLQKSAPAPAVAADKEMAQMRERRAATEKVQVTGRSKRFEAAADAQNAVGGLMEEQAPAAARAWLDRIETLLGEGRRAEAAASWAKFREKYPEYPVPDATRAKLE
jgi:hypothetical protein